jgi:hypothetical protein
MRHINIDHVVHDFISQLNNQLNTQLCIYQPGDSSLHDHLINGLWRPIFDRCIGTLGGTSLFANQERLELLLKKINTK